VFLLQNVYDGIMAITTAWMDLQIKICYNRTPKLGENGEAVNTYWNTSRLVNDNVTIGARNDVDFLICYWRFMTMNLMSYYILAFDNCVRRTFFTIDGYETFANSIFLTSACMLKPVTAGIVTPVLAIEMVHT
jgi:hypothetical protein